MKHKDRHYYLIYIQYLGFRYHGWQKQPDVKTVQGMVDKSLWYIFKHDNYKTMGSGRTDALVSANNFALELFMWEKLDADQLLIDLNSKLPPDICATKVVEVDHNFEIISGSKVKKYQYFFSFGERNHPFCAPFMAYLKDDLDIELMKEGAKLFIGTHNFLKYCYRPKSNNGFERTMYKSEIRENDIYTANFFPKKSFVFEIHGDGFMHHQVRLMMGTLFRLGQGEITLSDITESLKGCDNEHLGFIAPASGLMLDDVTFS